MMNEEAERAFAAACAHDAKGEEAEAVPLYELALAAGLDGKKRRDALIGLGSSLRNVGRLDDSVHVLSAAAAEFPDDAALLAFLALALYSRGDARAATQALLDLVLRHAPVGEYRRALARYRDTLDSEEME
jgi:tetratricopeptide (TPR) repeat protein